MALCTQKDFVRLRFTNDNNDDRRPSDGPKLPLHQAQTMVAGMDCRAWGDNEMQSRVLLEQVHSDGEKCEADQQIGRDNVNVQSMSKSEMIGYVQQLNNKLSSKQAEMQRIESLLVDTQKKLANVQHIVKENAHLRTKLRTSDDAVDRLNREHSLIQQNIRRRSEDSSYGRIRSDYEQQRTGGRMQPADEIVHLKRQLQALENEANRVAVAEAALQTCREDCDRMRHQLDQPFAACPPSGGEKSTDVAYLQTKVNELGAEVQRLRMANQSGGLRTQEISQQVELVLDERDRLRGELDKMCGIEGKVQALSQRAQSCTVLETERDALRDRCAEQQRQIDALMSDRRMSAETLRRLERENGKITERADLARQSVAELSDKLQTAAKQQTYIKSVEKDLENSHIQLRRSEEALIESQSETKKNKAQLNELNRQLADYQHCQTQTEERLRALNELESEVETLQTQLSAALAQQMSSGAADLVAAVKLTLLYVQNKLTSRETFGNEAELERLKAELLNVRDNRETEQLRTSREEVERLQALVNADGERNRKSVQLALGDVQQVRDGMAGLRDQMQKAQSEVRTVRKRAGKMVDKLAKKSAIIDEKTSTIEGLQQDIEQAGIRLSHVEDDLNAQIGELAQDNANLRQQIGILNGQMAQLDDLVEEIQQERQTNKGLESELNEFEQVLSQLPGDPSKEGDARSDVRGLDGASRNGKGIEGGPLGDVQYSVDALRVCTDQLEAEGAKNQALEQQLAQLKAHVSMLKEKLRRYVSRASELELADVTSQQLADQLMKEQNRNAASDKSVDGPSRGPSRGQNRNGVSDKSVDGRQQSRGKNRNGASANGGEENNKQSVHNNDLCKCSCCYEAEKDDNQNEHVNALCKKILTSGIGSLDMRELSELHYIIYLAGVQQTKESLTQKERNAFYKLKEKEHLMKVRELQQQVKETNVRLRRMMRDDAHKLNNNKSEDLLDRRNRANALGQHSSRKCVSRSARCPSTSRSHRRKKVKAGRSRSAI